MAARSSSFGSDQLCREIGPVLGVVAAGERRQGVCQQCRVEDQPAAQLVDKLAQLGIRDVTTFYRGRGCVRCNNTGFQGRIGVYELLVPDDTMRDMITAGASLEQLRLKAVEVGMHKLFEDAVAKMRRGITTLGEILRVTLAG